MDFYLNAEEQLRSANILFENGVYRTPVTNLYLACELYLKSLVEVQDPNNPYLDSHDIVNLGDILKDEFDFKTLRPKLNFLRKYLNDSRYPFNSGVYTKEFYEELLQIVLDVKYAIDNVNAAKPTKQLLEEKFGKEKVIDTTGEEGK